MKHNCENEFDLKEIYRKLVSPSKPRMVKASEFFAPFMTLYDFQQRMELAMQHRKQKGTVH